VKIKKSEVGTVDFGNVRLNNLVIPKTASDPEARIGAKSAKKFWYGFKKHVAVDMQSAA